MRVRHYSCVHLHILMDIYDTMIVTTAGLEMDIQSICHTHNTPVNKDGRVAGLACDVGQVHP